MAGPNGSGKSTIIKALIEGTDCDIDFEIVFSPGVLASLNKPDTQHITKLEQLFKLISVINASNMVYYDSQNRIKKTSSVFYILDEFIGVRINHYTLRKAYMLKELQAVINVLELKMRFIKDFISGKIKIMNVAKKQIVAQLKSLKYPIINESDSNSDSDSCYDILLRMPIYSLTLEKIDELQKKLDKNRSEHSILSGKSETDLWDTDLNVLVNS